VIAAIQETRWSKSTTQAYSSNGNIYTISLVNSKPNQLDMKFISINERLGLKRRFFNYSLIKIHAPTNDIAMMRPMTYSIKNLSGRIDCDRGRKRENLQQADTTPRLC
jgi:hypothetical protein